MMSDLLIWTTVELELDSFLPRLYWVTYSVGQVQIKWNLLIALFQPRSRGSSHGKEHFQDAVGPTQAKISK